MSNPKHPECPHCRYVGTVKSPGDGLAIGSAGHVYLCHRNLHSGKVQRQNRAADILISIYWPGVKILYTYPRDDHTKTADNEDWRKAYEMTGTRWSELCERVYHWRRGRGE